MLEAGDNWTFGRTSGGVFTEYSATPADQIDIWSGAAHFRTVDWSTYVLGLQNTPPYAGTDH